MTDLNVLSDAFAAAGIGIVNHKPPPAKPKREQENSGSGEQ
jgi:hypothetical protein